MIGVNLKGRAGNQLFQIATCVAHGLKHGVEYLIPKDTQNNEVWPPYFSYLSNENGRKLNNPLLVREISHNYHELPEPIINRDILLDGYWQSETYFKNYREQILKLFSIPYDKKEGWISIHVRRADYLLPHHLDKHPVVTKEYLNQAVNIFYLKGYNNFLIFSDDIQWCKQWVEEDYNSNIVDISEYNFKFSEGNDALKDLSLMSSCEHNIIANSTFSWWGTWLNRNDNKIVVCPHESNHFGLGNAHLDVSTLYPKEWLRIKY